jgi:hypothetical protein
MTIKRITSLYPGDFSMPLGNARRILGQHIDELKPFMKWKSHFFNFSKFPFGASVEKLNLKNFGGIVNILYIDQGHIAA